MITLYTGHCRDTRCVLVSTDASILLFLQTSTSPYIWVRMYKAVQGSTRQYKAVQGRLELSHSVLGRVANHRILPLFL